MTVRNPSDGIISLLISSLWSVYMYMANIISLTTNYTRVAVIPKSILILSEAIETLGRRYSASA